MGPLHTARQREEIEAMVEEAKQRGAKVVAGGERPEGEEYGRGFFYKPTLLVDVDPDSRIVQEECFGPALPIFSVKDLGKSLMTVYVLPFEFISLLLLAVLVGAIVIGRVKK